MGDATGHTVENSRDAGLVEAGRHRREFTPSASVLQGAEPGSGSLLEGVEVGFLSARPGHDDVGAHEYGSETEVVVRRLRVGRTDAPLSGEELMQEGRGTPPVEPIGTGGLHGTGHYWSWSPQWEAAAGRALAHLLVASEGQPVKVPDGLTADVFQRALDILLPKGHVTRRAALAGPGRPASDAAADILLVPEHPQTGLPWTPADPARSACRVPLPLGMWWSLTFPARDLPVPASGGTPDDVLRDNPLPPRPNCLFRADPGTFRRTLVRLPAVRRPWLRDILENLSHYTLIGLF